MTVLDILKTASMYLNLQDEFESFFGENDASNASETNEFKKLLKSFNLVVNQIAYEYCPILFEEQICFDEEGKFEISNLSKNLFHIFKISSNFKNYKYKIIDGKIFCVPNLTAKILYSFSPSEFSKNDSFNLFSGRVDAKTLALGTVGEYCFMSALFDDAEIWNSKFKQSLFSGLRKRSEIVMPKRRWI